MKIQVRANVKLNTKTECRVVALKPLKKIASQQAELNKATNKTIDKLQKNDMFAARKKQFINVPVVDGIGASSLAFIGVGGDKRLDNEAVRDILNTLASKLKALGVNKAIFDLDVLIAKSDAGTVSRHLGEALGNSEYKYTKLPVNKKSAKQANKEFNAILNCSDNKQLAAAKKGASIAVAINNGKTLAKNLGNMPGNLCTPTFLSLIHI